MLLRIPLAVDDTNLGLSMMLASLCTDSHFNNGVLTGAGIFAIGTIASEKLSGDLSGRNMQPARMLSPAGQNGFKAVLKGTGSLWNRKCLRGSRGICGGSCNMTPWLSSETSTTEAKMAVLEPMG